MIQISLDLISDLHTDTQSFDWTDQPTSANCIVLGDVGSDLATIVGTLEHLASIYSHVFYLDGNSEHDRCYDNLGHSYRELQHAVTGIKGVTYLQDNVVIINGIAILGTCGWFTFDFDSDTETIDAMRQFARDNSLDNDTVSTMYQLALSDSAYLVNSIKRLQKHRDVHTIVVCTHTVPLPCLVTHDHSLSDRDVLSVMGNSTMTECVKYDSEGKIKMWLFGHYHGRVDQTINGIRFLCNGRGRESDRAYNRPYYPVRIEFDI